ncbi:Hypothetical protein CINCED_3A017238 [Cinara cedri]|uniref:Uncharacterized protein n=1 Tax=Cinara cedri TaxID=506608 RepID=A0A5E4M214_9HEMI|nr:Hypothetical protein CINCED_3A017238 [Cinara cedri]
MICGTRVKPLPVVEKKWKPSKGCNRTKLLTLRHPTYISKLKKSIPRPDIRPIKSALPLWEEINLNEKISPFHGSTPTGPLVFHKGLMGSNPLQTKSKLDFYLNDPHNHEVAYRYHPLHDPHLKHWVNSKHNRKFLYKQGLLTDDMEVICTLKEYNEYRRYLWRKHNNELVKLLHFKDQQKIEQRKINNANNNHKKEIAKKLKQLNSCMSKGKPRNVLNNEKYLNTKCEHPNKRQLKPNLKLKKIETYTVYGLGKGGVVDTNKYRGTFIKGSPDDFHLLGYFNELFNELKIGTRVTYSSTSF